MEKVPFQECPCGTKANHEVRNHGEPVTHRSCKELVYCAPRSVVLRAQIAAVLLSSPTHMAKSSSSSESSPMTWYFAASSRQRFRVERARSSTQAVGFQAPPVHTRNERTIRKQHPRCGVRNEQRPRDKRRSDRYEQNKLSCRRDRKRGVPLTLLRVAAVANWE